MSDRIEYCARCHDDCTVGEDESPMCGKCKEMTNAEHAIVKAAYKARTAWGPGVMLRDIHDEMFDLVLAVDAWRKLKGKR